MSTRRDESRQSFQRVGTASDVRSAHAGPAPDDYTGISATVSPEAGAERPALTIEGLCHRFGARDVIRSLDLTVGPGERVALCGANGAGKTTVLRCVAGTLTPTSGSIRIGPYPAGTLEARNLIGVSLSQERSFYMRLSGRENLLFFARLRGFRPAAAANEVARLSEELQIDHFLGERVQRCSTGMIQQLAVARALIGDPRLMLLDEPTRSLDHDAVGRFWSAIDRRPDVGLLIATHREEDIERCDRRLTLSSPEPRRN
jgi:ABC-2 type transport system ATP-binding protein